MTGTPSLDTGAEESAKSSLVWCTSGQIQRVAGKKKFWQELWSNKQTDGALTSR